MLTGLAIRDVVLIEALDLAPAAGLTALTGETGAGKSIVLDALGLATGARADAGLVRRGAASAQATASFAPPADHPAWAWLAERGLEAEPGEDLILRRSLAADGRSRAFVNDQPTGVGALRELGALLLEVHGQHETVGLLDGRTHRGLLDAYGRLRPLARETATAWEAWREALRRADALRAAAVRADADREELTARLAELDRLDPREGEEEELVGRRALLGGAEKSLADVADARKALGGDRLTQNVSQALRALERARDRVAQAGVATGAGAEEPTLQRLTAAADALDRTLTEAHEAVAAMDAAANAFDYEPQALERAEERLFALRAAARKLGVAVEGLPAARLRFAEALRSAETASDALSAAEAAAGAAQAAYRAAASALSDARQAAGARLAVAVEGELAPLKLERARFRVAVEPLAPERAGPTGADRIEFEISTNPGAPFGPLGDIASGGELARFSLALKASLAARARSGEGVAGPVMIFDEVDQGVGGAVADAVGARLKTLAAMGQVLVVTHSPQVAARADAHWRVAKRAGRRRRAPHHGGGAGARRSRGGAGPHARRTRGHRRRPRRRSRADRGLRTAACGRRAGTPPNAAVFHSGTSEVSHGDRARGSPGLAGRTRGLVHRACAHRPGDRRAGGGAPRRGRRHLRAGRPHALAHAPARPDAARHRRAWLGGARGRRARGAAAGGCSLVRAGREALARRLVDRRHDARGGAGGAGRLGGDLARAGERRRLRRLNAPLSRRSPAFTEPRQVDG